MSANEPDGLRIAKALERIADALEIQQAASFWPEVDALALRPGDRVYDATFNIIRTVESRMKVGSDSFGVNFTDGHYMVFSMTYSSLVRREPARP